MYGNFNPYSYGMNSPYQQRLAQLEQQPIYQQTPVQPLQGPQSAPMLKGRVVASIDEAKAAQVDLDGSATYFVSPGEGKIYAKSIGMNGLPVFTVYEAQAPLAAPVNDFESRLAALENKVKELVHNGPDANVSIPATE